MTGPPRSEGMEYVTAGGATIPSLGFGTARMDDDETQRRAIDAAIAAGYRHIDTAQTYGSETAVGDAVRESGVDREEFFLTTKLSGVNRAADLVKSSTRKSLDRLDTDYVDLLLIHWPNELIRQEETLAAMNDLRDDGLVRHLGVSNFSVDGLRAAIASSDAPIVTNQVEYHVRNRQDELLHCCIENDVVLTAYSPLDVGRLVDDADVAAVADRYGKTAAQVAIRWLLDQPQVAAIPLSTVPAHVRENVDALGFELTDEDLFDLFALEGDPPTALRSALER